jgi:hypothetical protein
MNALIIAALILAGFILGLLLVALWFNMEEKHYEKINQKSYFDGKKKAW